MQKFNQEISIVVSVDAIALKLLGTFPEGYQHAELLTETIIGTSLEKGTVGYIYNALNGFTHDIDFKAGDVVNCKKEVNQYVMKEDQTGRERKYIPMGEAKVVDINLYTDNKLEVEYTYYNADGGEAKEKMWVNHKQCSGVKEREAELA